MKTMIPSLQTMKRAAASTPLWVACSLIGVLGGCASGPDSYVVSSPPPPPPTAAGAVTVTTNPNTATQTTQTTERTPSGTVVTTRTEPVSTVTVMQAPPAMQTEPVLAQPTSAHAWIPGYWTWRNNQYQWIAGRWEVPPHTNARWVAPRWEAEAGAYRFYEGYWN